MRKTNYFLLLILLLGVHRYSFASNYQFYFVGGTDGSAWKGVQQGLYEANLIGRFTQQTFTITALNLEEAVQQKQANTIILADLPSATLKQLIAGLPQAMVFNLSAEDTALRQQCRATVFHTIPSQAMRTAALQQWQTKHKAPPEGVEAKTWHGSFKKYAASDLNKRFKKNQGMVMDDRAWAGWAAVKLLADTIAQLKQLETPQLTQYLHHNIAFDGQKGQALTFRPTGQLRQPLLLIKDNKISAEAPIRGVKKMTQLDSLGLQSCQ